MSKKERRRLRKRQLRINTSLKKKLYQGVIITPCCYCKRVFLVSELTIEHITPRLFGGTNDPENIDLACPPCNQQRGREAFLLMRRNK